MRDPAEEDEEPLRTYASVIERLTTGSLPAPQTRQQQLLEHGRRRASALVERLAEIGTRARVLAHRVGERVGDPLHRHFGRRRDGARSAVPLHREPSIFVGLASFAFAFTVAWYTGGPVDEIREPGQADVAAQAVPPVAATVRADDAPQPAAWEVGQILRTPGASEATQLAVVDELSRDAGDDATKALLAGVDSASIYVSMACLRALAGRPCDAVAGDLGRRLDDSLWQRRAWAARVLGLNECAGSRRQLAHRLAIEPDLRVRAQLQQAIDSLKESGA